MALNSYHELKQYGDSSKELYAKYSKIGNQLPEEEKIHSAASPSSSRGQPHQDSDRAFKSW